MRRAISSSATSHSSGCQYGSLSPFGAVRRSGDGQPVLVIDELGRGAALGAELLARGMSGHGLDRNEPAVAHDSDASAARSALSAKCRCADFVGHAFIGPES
jgi:hypothetical protein